MTTMVRSVRFKLCSVVNQSGHVTFALQAAPPHPIASAKWNTQPE